jgi:polyribonucleotide nucleotidyltransferase
MNIPNKKEFTTQVHGRDLTFTVSDAAGQANAAVIGTYGGTSILATAVMGNEDRPGDFFPLKVDYEERFYAAGKVLGSRFVRREGRPSDMAVLSGRLIDRTIRPLFDSKLRREVQVVITVLSYDEQNDPDFLALITASMALSISDIPWDGPVAGVRALKNNGDVIYNPTNAEVEDALEKEGAIDAFFAGTNKRVNMIEVAAHEAQEDDTQKVFEGSFEEIKKLITFQEGIVKEIGKPKQEVALVTIEDAVAQEVHAYKDKFEAAMFTADKEERNKNVSALKQELFTVIADKELDVQQADMVLEDMINEVVHARALEKGERVDGRAMDQIRPLYAEVGLFERLHGSAYFSRGATQSLAVTTLAPPSQEQLVETMEISMKRRFMLHYNFPPYSTGEVGRMGSPSRREIGHGSLAAKALRPMIPSQKEFPYTIRVVSEILSSNGSSSMASTCAGTLSLMDAGVPIKKPVAGIAMGLMTWQGVDRTRTEDDFAILTDIQGPEDHYGDMDFKVAGTKDGITAIQMDVKVEGVNAAMFAQGIQHAQKARLQILEVMNKVIEKPREQLSPFAPVILTVSIHPDQIGAVIGSGGKVINGIRDDFALDAVDIEEDGSIFVTADTREKAQAAVDYIKQLTKEYEVGEIVQGEVVRLMDFGAIVDLGGGKDGMVHISEVNNDFVKDINTVLKLGQVITAKVIKKDNGKLSLSIKQAKASE